MPKDPRKLFDRALEVSFSNWIDEKGSEKHPSHWQRQRSDLSYDEAWKLIVGYKPHVVCMLRDMEYITNGLDPSYWEFGACNIASNGYGCVFIYINVSLEEADKLFNEFELEVQIY